MKQSTVILIFACIIISFQGWSQKDTLPHINIDSLLKTKAGISIKLNGKFSFIKQAEKNITTYKTEFISGNDHLIIKLWYDLSDSAARSIISDKIFLIENLFISQPSPYPDVVSNNINCPDRFRPQHFDTCMQANIINAISLFANERFVYGECNDESSYYCAVDIFAYNAVRKILAEVKYFTPRMLPMNKQKEVIKSVNFTE